MDLPNNANIRQAVKMQDSTDLFEKLEWFETSERNPQNSKTKYIDLRIFKHQEGVNEDGVKFFNNKFIFILLE